MIIVVQQRSVASSLHIILPNNKTNEQNQRKTLKPEACKIYCNCIKIILVQINQDFPIAYTASNLAWYVNAFLKVIIKV